MFSLCKEKKGGKFYFQNESKKKVCVGKKDLVYLGFANGESEHPSSEIQKKRPVCANAYFVKKWTQIGGQYTTVVVYEVEYYFIPSVATRSQKNKAVGMLERKTKRIRSGIDKILKCC